MASLQCRHSRACTRRGGWTAATREALAGCTCDPPPTLYAVHQHDGKMVRERLGRNRKEAQRQLDRIRVAVAERTYVPPSDITVKAFLEDEWLPGLRRPKGSTVYDYGSTVRHLVASLGSRKVRDVTAADIARWLRDLEKEHPKTKRRLSASTCRKHLRVAGAAFEEAYRRGIVGRNPCRQLGAAQKPEAQRREAGFFERSEVKRLLEKLPGDEAVGAIVRLALGSGLRQGELVALRWADVAWGDPGEIRVARTYAVRGKKAELDTMESTPKSGEPRRVIVTAGTLEALARWWKECGEPDEGCLVFPGDGGGYLEPAVILRRLYAAMEAAEVPRVDAHGRRRSFHSTRHTYAARCLEEAAPLQWVSEQLGHSDATVTARIYAHIGATERHAIAKRLEGALALV